MRGWAESHSHLYLQNCRANHIFCRANSWFLKKTHDKHSEKIRWLWRVIIFFLNLLFWNHCKLQKSCKKSLKSSLNTLQVVNLSEPFERKSQMWCPLSFIFQCVFSKKEILLNTVQYQHQENNIEPIQQNALKFCCLFH